MPDISIQDYAKEIFVRNKQSEFSRMNLKATGVATIPQLGVFFIEETSDGGSRLYSKTCNLRDGKLERGIKFYPDNHCIIWRDIQDENPAWAKAKYLDIPRGCVVFDANDIAVPMFIITVSLKYRGNKTLVSQIVTEFHLPAEKFETKYEELY